MMQRARGFTLIELMVALVAGSVAAVAAFSLASGISRQFYEHQRIAGAQGTSRLSVMELKHDIGRAGLFGTPNANKEVTCDLTVPTLPTFPSGTGPLAAFQYYYDEDTGVLDDNDMTSTNATANVGVRADRLRVLTSLSMTDALTVQAIKPPGAAAEQTIYFDEGLQSYRRTFLWGVSGDWGIVPSLQQFLSGDKNVSDPDGGTVVQYSARSERAFKTGSILHFESTSGAHFFRKTFGTITDPTTGRVGVRIATDLPLGSSCIAGNGQGMTVAPLEWVEYAVVDPFDSSMVGFMDLGGALHVGFDPDAGMIFDWSTLTASDLVESPNPMLVRRRLDANTGGASAFGTEVVAEFVSNFQVSFLVDQNSGSSPPDLQLVSGSAAETLVNAEPQRIRSVVIDLSVRSPFEDEELTVRQVSDAGMRTRFDIDPNAKGTARVRRLRVEVPVPNVGRRNMVAP